MPKTLDISAIGQSIDSTWGRSSTPKTASYSVKFTLLGGDRMMAAYQVVVNFASEREMIVVKRKCEEEAKDVVAAHLKAVKDRYKELSGSSLTTKEVNSTDSLEVVGFNVHNPKRTCLFRRNTVFEIA